MEKIKYILSNSGKFHHFEVAKALYRKDQLTKIVCGYPWFKLKKEKIPKNYVKCFGVFNGLTFLLRKANLYNNKILTDNLGILNKKNVDRMAYKYIDQASVLIALSGTGLHSGKKIIKNGKIYICERSSSHILFQQKILAEEYKELNQPPFIINKWSVDRELQEYEESNIILVPSLFVKKSFEKYYTKKVHVINFGINLKNFFPINTIKKDNKFFDILFIGELSIRKGLHYLIEAFHQFKHPNKRLHIVGSIALDNKKFFSNQLKDDNIFVYGHIDHLKLKEIINKSNVFVLPSLEDGLPTVILQALACGCPVIVSENTGGEELIRENKCGFVVPIKNSQTITDKLTLLSDDRLLLEELSNNALKFTQKNSWDDYVNKLDQLVMQFKKNCKITS